MSNSESETKASIKNEPGITPPQLEEIETSISRFRNGQRDELIRYFVETSLEYLLGPMANKSLGKKVQGRSDENKETNTIVSKKREDERNKTDRFSGIEKRDTENNIDNTGFKINTSLELNQGGGSAKEVVRNETERKSTTGNDVSTTVDVRFTTANDRSDAVDVRSTTGNGKFTTSANVSVTTVDARSTAVDVRSTTANDRATSSGRSTAVDVRSTTANDRATSSDRSTAVDVRSTTGNDRTTTANGKSTTTGNDRTNTAIGKFTTAIANDRTTSGVPATGSTHPPITTTVEPATSEYILAGRKSKSPITNKEISLLLLVQKFTSPETFFHIREAVLNLKIKQIETFVLSSSKFDFFKSKKHFSKVSKWMKILVQDLKETFPGKEECGLFVLLNSKLCDLLSKIFLSNEKFNSGGNQLLIDLLYYSVFFKDTCDITSLIEDFRGNFEPTKAMPRSELERVVTGSLE